jgi:hypothetical protein
MNMVVKPAIGLHDIGSCVADESRCEAGGKEIVC